MFHHGWREPNFFVDWVRETRADVRIYVVLGEPDNHLGLLEAMDSEGLFSRDSEEEYFAVGARTDAWGAAAAADAIIID